MGAFLMICCEGRRWEHIVANVLVMRGTIGMSYLRKGGVKAEEELICLRSPDLPVFMMFGLLERY